MYQNVYQSIYTKAMPSRIWGPLIVIGIFVLAGALIGVDIAMWPWKEPISLPVPTTLGSIIGFIAGVFIVWAVRQAEERTNALSRRSGYR